MKLFRNSIVGFLCALLLASCASFFEEEERETVYYAGEPQIEMSYADMARELSSGSVQVYGLDGPAPVITTPPSRAQQMPAPMMQGQPSPQDPNVIVYPLGDESPRAMEPVMPALSAPSSYRPLQSPFGGPIQTPAPPTMDEVSSIYFKHGSAAIGADGKQVIGHVAQRQPDAVRVDGHASQRAEVSNPVEREVVNLEMSMKRALKVSSELIRSGVSVEKIETRAFGSSRPAGPVDGISAEAASRRVEIYTSDGAVFPMTSSYPNNDEPAPIPSLVRY